MSGILNGIRVLDFTRVLAGPFATRFLADFGAEVIRVDPVKQPEQSRFDKAYYANWNRNKLAVSLDLNKAEGIDIAKRLVGISDVVAENFSPRVMPNLGLDYESLKQIKPDIIMLSMSVMGQTGPQKDYSGFGPTVHALSGMTYLTSYPGGPPIGPGFSYADHVSGLYGALAVLGALEERNKTGKGLHIDISETEAMSSLLGDEFIAHQIRGATAELPVCAPHDIYPCLGEDRWIAISVESEAEWLAFKSETGNPRWAEDAKFVSNSSRFQYSEDLDRNISEWTKLFSPEDVMETLQAKGVRAGVVQNAADLAGDPQLKDRHFFITAEHPEIGQITSDAQPVYIAETELEYKRGAPFPGEDSEYVFRELLGMGEVEVAGLKQRGII